MNDIDIIDDFKGECHVFIRIARNLFCKETIDRRAFWDICSSHYIHTRKNKWF